MQGSTSVSDRAASSLRRPVVLLFGLVMGAATLANSQSITPLDPDGPAHPPATTGIADTCFPNDTDPNAARLAQAMMLVENGVTIFGAYQGSAVVIANSAGENGLNQLLTVAHVTRNGHNHPSHEIQLTASDNTPIGAAVAVGTPWRYHRAGSKYDITVLTITSFHSAEAEAKYRAIQGIELEHIQAKSGYLHGLINDPVPPTNGSSGGAIVNGQGHLIGLLAFVVMRSQTQKVPAVAIGLNAQFSGKEMEVPVEGRTYGVSIFERSIWKKLHRAGEGITLGMPQAMPVTSASFPQKYCSYSHGLMAPLKSFNADTTNFDTQADQPAVDGSFEHWSQPKRALGEVKALLGKARDEHLPDEAAISALLTALAGFPTLKQIPFASGDNDKPNAVTIDTITRTLNDAAGQTHDPAFAEELLSASQHLPASWYMSYKKPMPINWLQGFWE